MRGGALRRFMPDTGPVLAIVAIALFALTATAGEDPAPAPVPLAVIRSHLDSLRASDPVSPAEVVESLVELGKPAATGLLATTGTYRGREHVKVVVAALIRLDPVSVDLYLLEFTSGPENDPGRITAYSLLGERGSEAAVPKLIAGMDDNHPRTKRSAELALVRLLRRHDRIETYQALTKPLASVSDETRARVICSIGDTDSEHGMRTLLKLLYRWPELNLAVVSAIAQMPDAVPPEETVPVLHELLGSTDQSIRRETVTALGLMKDAESAAILIGLLEDPNGGVRGNAHGALKNITGLGFPQDANRWRLWHREENAWWETDGRRLLEILESGSEAEVLAALKTLGERCLFRDRIAPALTLLLQDESAAVRSAAERLLGKSGAKDSSRMRDLTASLAASGFFPAPDCIPENAAEPVAVEPPASHSMPLVPIVGTLAFLVLFLRIFGLSMLDKIVSFWPGLWSAKHKVDGPMTIKLKPKSGRSRSSGPARSRDQAPDPTRGHQRN